MCWRKEAGGGEGAADAAVKTKTPHDNVGKKHIICEKWNPSFQTNVLQKNNV